MYTSSPPAMYTSIVNITNASGALFLTQGYTNTVVLQVKKE